ncbi:MAG TPA: Uma2 family endonuclease [Kofleriaceae bacterium]|nr:Uma2 family endonuclease [Kofleriaceae bacterium]
MTSLAELRQRDEAPVGDQIVQLHGVSWTDYERLLDMRGDHSAPRISYLEGTVEIMSPSEDHEGIKSSIGCLVEVYCLASGIEFRKRGSWTLKNRSMKRGVEPDECYIFGTGRADRPHLAIEVIWTWGGLDKLEIYRRLGVREVWVWRRGRIQVHVLRGERFAVRSQSKVLPGIDLDELTGFLDRPTTSQSIREYRAALDARR